MAGFQANITGRVQGVGFRWFVQRNAERLNLSGFARNLPNGDVEVQAEGSEQALQQLIAELQKGPGMSRVDNVDFTWKKVPENFSGFRIRH